jgi:hypothetical protein
MMIISDFLGVILGFLSIIVIVSFNFTWRQFWKKHTKNNPDQYFLMTKSSLFYGWGSGMFILIVNFLIIIELQIVYRIFISKIWGQANIHFHFSTTLLCLLFGLYYLGIQTQITVKNRDIISFVLIYGFSLITFIITPYIDLESLNDYLVFAGGFLLAAVCHSLIWLVNWVQGKIQRRKDSSKNSNLLLFLNQTRSFRSKIQRPRIRILIDSILWALAIIEIIFRINGVSTSSIILAL